MGVEPLGWGDVLIGFLCILGAARLFIKGEVCDSMGV